MARTEDINQALRARIARWLAHVMRVRGLKKQRQLAELLHLSKSTVSLALAGKRCGLEVLGALHAFSGVADATIIMDYEPPADASGQPVRTPLEPRTRPAPGPDPSPLFHRAFRSAQIERRKHPGDAAQLDAEKSEREGLSYKAPESTQAEEEELTADDDGVINLARYRDSLRPSASV